MEKPVSTPRLNPLFELDSDEEELGQERILSKNVNKFTGNANSRIKNVLNTDKLLDNKAYSLSEDFEKLVLYSATQQTWLRHCSAWKLFDEFCEDFNICKTLPAKIKTVRAFSTWAVSTKGKRYS